jgi:hypothetical protein
MKRDEGGGLTAHDISLDGGSFLYQTEHSNIILDNVQRSTRHDE